MAKKPDPKEEKKPEPKAEKPVVPIKPDRPYPTCPEDELN